jgi:glycosyltransferase involved in cell wall biosynthesis
VINLKIVSVIPCHNEEKYIGSVVLKTKKYVDHVIVVDDGSIDKTGEVAELAGAIVVSHDKNMGKGMALNTGIKKAQELCADICIFLDGDYQHNPDEIPFLINPIINENVDIVVGSRFLYKNKMPLYRKFGEHILTFTSNIGSQVRLTDSQSGFRALSKKALERLQFNSKGFSVESELQFLAKELGLKIKEVPISVNYEDKPKRNPFYHGISVLMRIITFIGEKRPLLFFGVSGIIILFLGILVGLFVVDRTYKMGILPVGAAMISLLLCIIGTLTLFIGIVLNSVKNLIKRGEK